MLALHIIYQILNKNNNNNNYKNIIVKIIVFYNKTKTEIVI